MAGGGGGGDKWAKRVSHHIGLAPALLDKLDPVTPVPIHDTCKC